MLNKYFILLTLGVVGVVGALWPANVVAHPLDVTSVEFFVVEDWAGNPVETGTLRAVHTLNWLEALALVGATSTTQTPLVDFTAYETQLFSYLQNNVKISNQGKTCTLTDLSLPEQTSAEVVISGLYLLFTVECEAPLTTLTIEATFLVDKFPNQTNYIGVYRTPSELIADTELSKSVTEWQVAVGRRGGAGYASAASTPSSLTTSFTNSNSTYAERVLGWLPNLLSETNLFTILLVLGAVFLIGLLHTLEAGHSKIILASLMIEKNVTFRKGIWYVVVFTLTHVADIIIIGLVLLALSSFYETAALFTEISRVAYILLLGIGVYLLSKTIANLAHTKLHHHKHHHDHAHKEQHTHHHGHSHDHHHDHSHTPHGVTLREQLTVAFLTGLAPCLMGWSVLLLILASGQVWLIVPAILVFGLGIGAGLLLIMIATVYLKDKIHGRFHTIGLYAPLVSALILTITAIWLLL